MRKNLEKDFLSIYIIDLGGNVRQNPKLSGTTHNVFGIQVGVAITILVKHVDKEPRQKTTISYASTPTDWRRGQKTALLDEWKSISGAKWKTLRPDAKNTWLTD